MALLNFPERQDIPMIRYLQRLRGKKGFTMVELIVVIAIIAVLTAFVMVGLNNRDSKIKSASSSAESFFAASQLALTRAQLTERSIVDYADTDVKYIEYTGGANTTGGKYLFIEAQFSQNGIVGLHLANTFNGLMARTDAMSNMTTLESYLSSNINEYLNGNYDGYFYCAADSNFKVLFTHFCSSRLPAYDSGTQTLSNFRDSMMIMDGCIQSTGQILGSWSDVYIMPDDGQYVFDLPKSTDPDYAMYLA